MALNTERAVASPRASREAGFTMPELLMATIIVMITIGITTNALMQTQRGYTAQRERMETANQARAAMDAMTRLVRMAGSDPLAVPGGITALDPDPDGDNALNSINVQADWNPADGDIDDPYENITFSVADNQLVKREPADAADVLFAENVQAISFTYQDTNENAIANPIANAGNIAFVTIRVQTRSTAQVQDGPALTISSSVAVRRKE